MRRLDLLPMVRWLLCFTILCTVGRTARAEEERHFKVYRLQQGSAEEVANTLEILLPNSVVNFDSRRNLIHVMGTDEEHAQIADWLRELDGTPEPRLIRVSRLSHRLPEETAELLMRIIKDDPRISSVSITADERANALLVRATEEELNDVEQLLQVIDTEPAAARDVKVFALRNADAASAGRMITDIFAGAAITGVDQDVQLRVAVDERTNSVIATGQPDALTVVEALLFRLDAEGERAASDPGPLRVRVLWVVSGDEWGGDEQAQLATIPGDLDDVAAELDSLGITNPRIASQMVVNSLGRFSISGTAGLGSVIQVAVNGAISPGEGAAAGSWPTLDISISAIDAGGLERSQGRTLCHLDTTLRAPLGHFVVLGVSPIDARSSAFVVQVSPASE